MGQEVFLGSQYLLAARRARTVAELGTAAYLLMRVARLQVETAHMPAHQIINAMGMAAVPGSQLMDHFRVFEERLAALAGPGTPPAPTRAAPTLPSSR